MATPFEIENFSYATIILEYADVPKVIAEFIVVISNNFCPKTFSEAFNHSAKTVGKIAMSTIPIRITTTAIIK